MDWNLSNKAEFTTASENDENPCSFIFGSCRYLLRLFGGLWFDERGDKTFRSILNQIKDNIHTDQLLMVGDQIYADDLNFFIPDENLDEYNRRYREVFSQQYIRELMSCIPTYMTLDDHEIEDAWPARSSERDWMIKYPAAIHAYQTYQLSHSPLFAISDNRITGVPMRFWYTYRDGCCDFFVTDTRTERYLTDNEEENEIISEEQLDALKKWLSDESGRFKFIVSAVPFFPDTKKESKDKWSGFPSQRAEILDWIREKKIKKVVFLSGDVHCSMSAELTTPKDEEFRIISIISSAFFWPYPHLKRRAFKINGEIRTNSSLNYKVEAEQVYSTDNFTRVTAKTNSLQINVFSRKGDLLGDKTYSY